ncbi:hypothetical protein Phep_3825 [Pedobacter heparinus DSM 2366]|uniref:Uncharacterized protein n=2 Tax=Pedobacter heparinus TaxID=984 RepID=C6XV08_PEDHD|nr:hypothetical protein Phep_3825 [Pedobacter heparinus DSM 2366]
MAIVALNPSGIMKAIYFPILLLFLCSCSRKPKHPQAGLINQRTAASMSEKDILQYADSIDANSKDLEKQTSLVYQLGDQLMYASQYSWNGSSIMFIEYISNEGLSNQTRKYYLKNDSLVLVKEKISMDGENAQKYTESRAYIRNNIVFKKESRLAVTEAALKSNKYTLQQTPAKNNQEFAENILRLKDAVRASNKFEVVFDNIISVAEESRILLKNKLPDGYSATVVVRDQDAFIDSLISIPAVFKDKKLNFKWQVNDKEAVYVPVAASVTSASGLNR